MRFLIICSIVLLSGCVAFPSSQSNYSVELAPRGLSYSTGNQVLESRLCDGDYCVFVEQRELKLLNIDLGDNPNEIFKVVSNMNQFERTWLFKDLERVYTIGL